MFNSIKQKFLIKQTGHLAPMGQMQKEVYSPKLNETEWLRSKVAQAGGVPNGRTADLWQQLNGLLGYPVANFINENRKIYFQNNS